MAEVEQPIIIKKINKIEDGHHGGAWKVAYADFVTAMMAFFLLLWLLSSASDGQLNGIADYFTPTIGLTGEMGIGFEGGTSNEVEEGTKKSQLTKPGIVLGQSPQGVKVGEPKKRAVIESPEGEDLLFEQRGSAIKQSMANEGLRKFSDNVMVEQTPEGLKIQLLDSDKESMFKPGNTSLTETGKELLGKMAEIIRGMPNHISITGHTDAVPFNSRRANYTNWELSTERANAARRYILRQGMLPERIAKVLGKADTSLLVPEAPQSPKNRRIEIILLRGSHLSNNSMIQPALGGFLPAQNLRNDVLDFEDEEASSPSDKTVKEIKAQNLETRAPISQEALERDAEPTDALEYLP